MSVARMTGLPPREVRGLELVEVAAWTDAVKREQARRRAAARRRR